MGFERVVRVQGQNLRQQTHLLDRLARPCLHPCGDPAHVSMDLAEQVRKARAGK